MGVHPLEGMTIGVTADRRADEQAELLVRRGARVLRGPTIRTLPLGPDERIRQATEDIVRRPPHALIANTGVGVRGWLALAESWGLAEQLLESLAGARLLCRGPKAAGALTTAGLPAHWQARSERLDEVVSQVIADGVEGRRVAVQLDGNADPVAPDRLRAAGAEVIEIPVYRWTLPEDVGPALRLVGAACSGRVDAVTFTAAPAVHNLFLLAAREGMSDELRHALDGPVLAMCVGPVCRDAALEHGVSSAEHPERARLGSMVQTLTTRLTERRRVVDVDGHRVVVQGSLVLVGDHRLELRERERNIFDVLARRPGVVVAKRTILAEVWGSPQQDAHVLEVTIGRLRKRLAPAGLNVEAVVRRGYRLEVTRPEVTKRALSRSHDRP
jgi:uroporphyrinogen-III synthase